MRWVRNLKVGASWRERFDNLHQPAVKVILDLVIGALPGVIPPYSGFLGATFAVFQNVFKNSRLCASSPGAACRALSCFLKPVVRTLQLSRGRFHEVHGAC